MMVHKHRLRHGRVLLNEDATGSRDSVVKEADDHSGTLSFLGRRQRRYNQVRSNLNLLVGVNLINEATALNGAGRAMFRSLNNLGISLDQRVTFNIRLVMRTRQDVLTMTRVLFDMDLMGTFKRDFFVTVTHPRVLALLTIGSNHAHVLARERSTLKDRLNVARRNRYRVLIIITNLKIIRGLNRLFIVHATRRRESVTRNHINRHHRAFKDRLRGKLPFRLARERVILNRRVMFDVILSRLRRQDMLRFQCVYRGHVCLELWVCDFLNSETRSSSSS